MTQPTQSERDVRIQKLHKIQSFGINPFPEKYDKKQSMQQIIEMYENGEMRDSEDIVQNPQPNVQTAGRIVLKRTHGKLAFARLQDETGQMQLLFHKDNCHIQKGEETATILKNNDEEISAYKFFEKLLDMGDFIGVQGEVFKTHKGELTIFVTSFAVLTKAIRGLPEKYHGLHDIDSKLRKRYLDTVMDKETHAMVMRRGKFWNAMRTFLLERSFLEVETPVLEVTTGGADANPFVTHHEALDMDVFLRISCGELRQKRLMVGGFEKTFEIGRIFRNEGMSPEHAQDYTQMECYRSYADRRMMMQMVKEMYLYVIDTVYGTRKFHIRGYDVDFDQERKEVDYHDTILDMTGIDIYAASEEDMAKALDKLKVSYEGGNKHRLIDTLRKYCRKKIAGPAFLTNVPKIVSPLAKSDPENPEITHRFQVLIAGSEVGNAFSELNDPLDQAQRFDEQQAMRDAGDDEAQMADWEFVEALEHGMPPTAGFGVSERLFCFLENKPIRECQIFPLMKPFDHDKGEYKKSQNTKIAVALINDEMHLLPWQKMNTVAHLNASFAARKGKSLIREDKIATHDGQHLPLNIQHAIMIKEIPSNDTIRQLHQQASEKNIDIVVFTKEMLETTNDSQIKELTAKQKHDEIHYYGILLFGDKKDVESLTKEYPLYSGEEVPSNKNQSTVETLDYTDMPSVADAEKLAESYLSDTLRHCQQVGQVMRRFAKKLGQPEDVWYIAGLLHDVDRDHINKDAAAHLGGEFDKIAAEINMPVLLKDDIRSHYTEKTGVPIDSLLRKYLASVDELTGFIHAVALMRPNGMADMQPKSVKKKIKDKKFAAGVSREHLLHCETYLDIPFDTFCADVIQAMQDSEN